LGKLRWVMETSMLKTLAEKHKSTVAKMARKYKAIVETANGSRTCFSDRLKIDNLLYPHIAVVCGGKYPALISVPSANTAASGGTVE
jgi:hypothetical protein